MKNKNKFNSYASALKRLELLTGENKLNEAVKYVLKPKSTNPVPNASTETESLPSEPAIPQPETPVTPDETSPATDDMDTSTDLPPEENGDETDVTGDTELDYFKSIQKLTGKLGQKLRDSEDKMESDDIKYVINSILSAVDMDKLESEDKEEILSKFDEDSETESSDTEVPTDDSELPDQSSSDDELTEVIDDLDEFINTPIDTDNDDYSFGRDEWDDENEEGEWNEPEEFDWDNKERRDDYTSMEDDTKDYNFKFDDSTDQETEEMDEITDDDLIYTGSDNDEDVDEQYYEDKDHSYYGAMRNTYDSRDYERDFDPEDDENIDNDEPESVGKCKYCGRKNGHFEECPNYVDESNTEYDQFESNTEYDQFESDDNYETRELDIDELTNSINKSVKETLSKYFK